MRNWRRSNEPENNSYHVDNYDSDSDSDESSSTNESAFVVSESEISYSIESFNAVVTPVTITMVASALAVVFINTEETIESGEEAFASTYQILNVSNDQSAAQNLGNSLVNTLAIVSVLCALTFLVVLCYKFKCMKLFYAFMVLVTAGLLGFFTSQILFVAFSIYPWMGNIDKLSLTYLLYNYAAVGTLSIFLPRGFPRWVPQGYLIAGSVCLAWELSFFNAWMTWSLLCMLALYDLLAVLSPCGPLKALAELISRDGAPALPGMIYEAELPAGVERRSQRRASEQQGEEADNSGEVRSTVQAIGQLPQSQTASMPELCPDASLIANSITQQQSREQRKVSQSRQQMDSREHNGNVSGSLNNTRIRSTFTGQVAQNGQQQHIRYHQYDEQNRLSNAREASMPMSPPDSVDMSNKGKVPLVLARMYKLSVFDKKGVLRPREQNANEDIISNYANEGNIPIRPDTIYYTAEEIDEIEWTPQQLRTVITCIFPPRGGRIVKAKSREQKYGAGTAYIVYGRSGNQQRKFVVTPTGSVKEVLRREASGDGDDNGNEDEGDTRNTIKLGIGDFVFYSLLVSQAAKDSFTAFAACLLVVLTGLAATLMILAIKGKALPALPISVFLGVVFFLWTTTFLKPWIRDFVAHSIYV